MAKTLIMYALSALHPAIFERVITPAREGGQSIRLIGSDFFQGDAETGAAGVVVVRTDGDEDFFSSVEATYPDIEIQSTTVEDLELPTLTTDVDAKEEKLTIKDLRAQLVKLGGSVPAGATVDKLSELIAEAELNAAKGDDK